MVGRLKLVAIGERGQTDTLSALPPEARDACTKMVKVYQKEGFRTPWLGYLAFNQNNDCVGTCAFKSQPKNNQVEIAYFTFPKYQKQGIATGMAQELIGIVKANRPGLTVTAQTLPGKNASNSVLKKLGFEFHGSVDHPKDGKVWEWWLAT